MSELHSEIEINATPEKVWRILTDFDEYPEWNPFILSAEGSPVEGQKLEVEIHAPGHNPMKFRPKVIVSKPNSEFRWLGRFGIPGLFDGEHILKIVPMGGNRVKFIQQETFTGALVRFFKRRLLPDTLEGFNLMNRALKVRAENEATEGDRRKRRR